MAFSEESSELEDKLEKVLALFGNISICETEELERSKLLSSLFYLDKNLLSTGLHSRIRPVNCWKLATFHPNFWNLQKKKRTTHIQIMQILSALESGAYRIFLGIFNSNFCV